MNVKAQLDPIQTDNLELSIKITMPIRKWKSIANDLKAMPDVDWTGTRTDFINNVFKTINEMTGQLENVYPNNHPEK